MKTAQILIASLALLFGSITHSFATTYGQVLCDANQNGQIDSSDSPVPGVLVVVTNISGTFSNANWSGAPDGVFAMTLNGPDTYVEYIHPLTLPAGATVSVPSGGIYQFTTTAANPEFQGSFLLSNTACQAGTPGLQLFKTADNSVVEPGQPVTYTYTVTNSGSIEIDNITIVDDNGTPGDTSDDTVVGTVATLAPGAAQSFTYTTILSNSLPQQLCADLGEHGGPKGGPNGSGSSVVGTVQTTVLPSGDIQVVFTQENVNDNRYGTGATAATGWTHGHKFQDLVGSDHAEFRFTDGAGNVVLDFNLDYISQAYSAAFPSGTVSYPSGYGTLGVSGGDGKMIKGSASDVLFADTSLTENFLQPQFQSGYLVNSPPETVPNSGVSVPAGWDYVNSYTVVVSQNAFGANGFGSVTIPYVHNSPPKTGSGAISPSPCGNNCVVNVAVATGTAAGAPVMAQASAQVCLTHPGGCASLSPCTPPYPFHSPNPLTSVRFSESSVLRTAVVSVVSGCVPQSVEVFYSDEHALLLGIREVQVKQGKTTSTTGYPVTPVTANPGSAINPQVGSTITSGAQAGTDVSGRPIYPALFITDLTANPANPYAGDWQNGGTPIPPSAVFGTWKAAVKIVGPAKSKPKPNPHNGNVSIKPDRDPAKNGWNLGPGSDPVPAGLKGEAYGAEIRWDLSSLGLVSGHSYRLYFMVHDGDQNKAGGDAGQACAILNVP